MAEKEVPQKLAELGHLAAECDGDWFARHSTRGALDKVRIERWEGGLVGLAEALVNDYFTSRASELFIEPQVRIAAREIAKNFLVELDRWAR